MKPEYPHADYVRRIVDAAPPLSDAVAHRLAVLLRPAMGLPPLGGGSSPTPATPPSGVRATPEPRVALYRHWDAAGVLLYIGITNNLRARTRAHSRRSSWVEFAVRAEAEWFETRDAAEQAEQAAIQAERPLFNGMHASPESKKACVAYLVKHDRLDLLQFAR